MNQSDGRQPSADMIASARRILEHIKRHSGDVGDNDPEFAVMREEAEAVLREAGKLPSAGKSEI